MDKTKSITKFYFYSLVVTSCIIVISIGALWVKEELDQFQEESIVTKKEYIKLQKEKIQSEVSKVVAYIEYKESLAEERLKKQVKERTNEAYKTALHIYEQNKNKSLSEIKQLTHDALFAASWDDGRGYYFAEDMAGTELVNRNNPDLEGINIIDIQDSKGNYIMRDILAVANSETREGFCSYYWNKPENPSVLVPKISYVKYFEPLDWVIGTGKYLDDEERNIQEEIISYIDKLKINDGYVFVGTWTGYTLSGPAKGRNMIDVQDSQGVRIVQELIRVAKSGGGFVQYVMPRLKGQRPAPKVSYSMAVPDWQWYVGTGVYLDEIDKVITQKLDDLKNKISLLLFKIIVFLILIILLSYLLAKYLTKKIVSTLEIFNNFFKKAGEDSQIINENNVYFSEFKSLAKSANQMIEHRCRVLKEKESLEAKLLQNQKMEAIGTLAGGIAHDFNNILSAIYGYSQLAEVDIDGKPENAKEDIRQVLKASDRAKDLVKQILAFSRKTEHNKQPLQIALVIKETLKLLRSSIPTTIEINQEVNTDAVISADPTKIHQIIMNLCTNAYHAMRDSGGNLTVFLDEIVFTVDSIPFTEMPPGKYVLLKVSDNGIGMNADTLSKIFEPYFTTKEAGEGTGLGLAAVHGIVTDHKGHIHVYSEINQGTSFHIYFPIIKDKALSYNIDKIYAPTEGGHEKIMVVDDEEQIVSLTDKVLSKHGYKVATFSNGVQALQDIKKQPDYYDLIVTDQTMPYMTGIELTKEILAINPQLPVILTSGLSETINEGKAKAVGVKEYCSKPVDVNLLLQKIRKILDELPNS